jgi:hypothetical protein
MTDEYGKRVDIILEERSGGRGKNGLKKCKTRCGGKIFFFF